MAILELNYTSIPKCYSIICVYATQGGAMCESVTGHRLILRLMVQTGNYGPLSRGQTCVEIIEVRAVGVASKCTEISKEMNSHASKLNLKY